MKVISSDSKNRIKCVGATLPLILFFLSGCTAMDPVPPVPSPTLTLVVEDAGWVKITVSDIPSPGYVLQWGDVATAYGTSGVAVGGGDYEHFYQEVGTYTISLVDSAANVVAGIEVTTSSVDCRVSPVSVEGRMMTVCYFGRDGISYIISWGDGHSSHVCVQNGPHLLTHTYETAGTYYVGMSENWAPMRTHFSVDIE